MRSTKRHSTLPIGRTARIAYEIDALRLDCCKTARALVNKKSLDEIELEECARLDDVLAQAQRMLKQTVRDLMLSRLNRRSQRK